MFDFFLNSTLDQHLLIWLTAWCAMQTYINHMDGLRNSTAFSLFATIVGALNCSDMDAVAMRRRRKKRLPDNRVVIPTKPLPRPSSLDCIMVTTKTENPTSLPLFILLAKTSPAELRWTIVRTFEFQADA